MGTPLVTPLTPTAPRTPDKAAVLANDIACIAQNGREQLAALADFARGYLSKIWTNPAYSAEDYITARGTNAKADWDQSTRLLMFLAGEGIVIDTSMVRATAANEDGTITVTGA